MTKYSEAELILPALYAMSGRDTYSITTSDLIADLRSLLKPNGEDLARLKNRNDDKFSQIVRNLVSHKTLEKLGYASYSDGVFTLTALGVDYINEPDNKVYIEDRFAEDFEGVESINYNQNVVESGQEVISGSAEDRVDDDENGEEEEHPSAESDELSKEQSPNSLNIDRTHFSVFELKRKMEKGKLILDPEFQRKNVWSNFQKSELVESILMNIPLPFIYLTEDKKGNLIVVDGRQRLTALFEFLDGDVRLSRKLKILDRIKGKKFADLEPLAQGAIEDYQLTTHIIKRPTSDRLMIDIFDRVNRSGTTLNNQEIRNALYQGNSTRLLKNLAESDEFKIATGGSVKNERMKDRYLILRMLSFYLWRTEFGIFSDSNLVDYKGDTEEFLARYMQYINSFSDRKVQVLTEVFYRAMKNAIELIGPDAFRLPNKKDDKKRPINMALFESLSYAIADPLVGEKADLFKHHYSILLEDQKFLDSFLSIDSTVKYRFEKMDQILSIIKG